MVKLSPNETGKTSKEALEILAVNFQEALTKGFSVKEIREILGAEGVTLALGKMRKRRFIKIESWPWQCSKAEVAKNFIGTACQL